MSEGVGACILSWGELCCPVRDASDLVYFLVQIGADLHSISLTNGKNAFGFPESSQLLEAVLLPFFEEQYSEHLLIGIFHGEEDGSWILAGNTRLCFWDVAKIWKKAKNCGVCQHLRIVVQSCHSGWWAHHAADCGCPSVSVQAACGTGDLCETPDDPDYSFISYWVYRQREQRQLLQKENDYSMYKDDERMVEAFGACYWCAHGGKSAAAMFLGEWACVGKALPRDLDGDGDQKAITTHSGHTSDDAHGAEIPLLLKNLVCQCQNRDENDMLAILKSFVEHRAARLKKKRHFLIVCDGNIGCGKTTFLNEIHNSQHLPSDVHIYREPVAKNVPKSWWSLLEKFYEDMKNGKGPAAVIELENAIWAHHRNIATQRESHVITERCCDSSVWVFCKALQKEGILPEGEFKKFMVDLSQMNADVAHKPTLVLYFRLTVEEAMRRIKQRAEEEGRKFEEGIDEKYLQELDSMYEELYKDREDVIRLDSNMPPDEIKREVADQLKNNIAKYHRVLEDKGLSKEEAEELLMYMISCFVNRIEPALHAEGDQNANTRPED